MAQKVQILLFGLLLSPCIAYLDLDPLQDTTPEYISRGPVPRPWQLLPDDEMSVEVLPSMITAIAPSTTMAANGTLETMYSVHYHHFFVRSKQGTGIFKRGVFRSDPPIATCTPCGFQGTLSQNNTTGTNTSPLASCTLHTYLVRVQALGKESNADRCLGRFPFVCRCCWCCFFQLLLWFTLFWRVRALHDLKHQSAMLFHYSCFVPIERQLQHVIHVYNRCLPI